jgi:predicted nucleotidyltransferase
MKIFTTVEVQGKHVPTRESFVDMERVVRDVLGHEAGVVGAILFGSVPDQVHTPMSDLNVFVLYMDEHKQRIREHVRSLTEQATAFCVPLRFVLLNQELAMRGEHDFGPLWLDVLDVATELGGSIKEPPLPYIRPLAMTPEQELRSYLSRHLVKLELDLGRFRVMSEPEQAQAIGDAYSFSFCAARQMLQYLIPSAQWCMGNSLNNLITFYPKLAIELGTTILETMVRFSDSYALMLHDFCVSRDMEHYRKVFLTQDVVLQLAREFVEVNLVALRTLRPV